MVILPTLVPSDIPSPLREKCCPMNGQSCEAADLSALSTSGRGPKFPLGEKLAPGLHSGPLASLLSSPARFSRFTMRYSPVILWLISGSLALSGLTGCVSRRMTIRTNPSGALVEVDGKRLGTSPVSTDFTYYGTHEFTISAPGYETLTVQQKVRTPLYQYFPIDFFTNHFMPGRVTDRHDFSYTLQPSVVPIDEEQNLINRGRNFRSQSEVGR